MKYIRKKEILIAIGAFLLGIGVMTLMPTAKQNDNNTQLEQYKLFDTEEKIISVSDHAFVTVQSCYANPSCDMQRAGDTVDNLLKYRKQYEVEKKQLISQYPSLVSEEDRKLYRVSN